MPPLARPLFFLIALTLGACAGPSRAAREALHGSLPASGRLPSDVRPLRYRLDLRLDPASVGYKGHVEITLALERPRDVLWLNGRGLALHRPVLHREGRAAMQGTIVDAGTGGAFAVVLPEPVGPGPVTLGLVFSGRASDQCHGLYRHRRGADWYLFSQLEATYARDVFPSLDEPGFKTPFDVAITAPAGTVALSNAREVRRTPLGASVKTVFATTPPLPTYLLAFAVGPFDLVDAPPLAPNAVRSRPLPLRGAAWRGAGEKLRWSLAQTPPLLDDLERYVGSEYPFDKLDFIATPCARPTAMENPGAVTFHDELLLVDPARSSESDRRAAASTIAHELAHMWFGNSVTPRWWNDLWLNEAFANWLGSATVGRRRPEDRADIELVRETRHAMTLDDLASTRAIRHDMKSEREIDDAFNDVTYDKGAAVLGMVERLAGPTRFQQSLRSYLARHRNANATADDLLGALERGAGADASSALRSFLQQPGVPRVEARLDCRGPRPALRLRQSRDLPLGSGLRSKQAWQIPFCVRYPQSGTTQEACTLLRDAEGSLTLPTAGCPAWVMPNADGAGYYRWQLPAADLRRLAAALPSLDARERISFVDAVQAAWARADLDPADALGLLAPLVDEPEPEIAAGAARLLSRAHPWLAADPPARLALERYAGRLYGAPLAALGPKPRDGESSERKQTRDETLAFLALTARDAEVRAGLAAIGREHLLAKADRNPPDDLALRVAVGDGDALLFEITLERLASAPSGQRWRYLRALAAAAQPEQIARARRLVFEQSLSNRERYWLLHAMMQTDAQREETWAWLTSNLSALRAQLDDEHRRWLPQLAANLCEARHADGLGALFADVADRPEGRARIEASAEQIRACVAQRGALLEPLRAFLTQQPR